MSIAVLEQARRHGLVAFDASLPPTGMRIEARQAHRLANARWHGDFATTVPLLRQLVHYTDPVLAPRIWAL